MWVMYDLSAQCSVCPLDGVLVEQMFVFQVCVCERSVVASLEHNPVGSYGCGYSLHVCHQSGQ